MVNMVLSYQFCMPINRGSLCPLSTLKSNTKKTNNLCFSTTPLLLRRMMPCITGSSSSSSLLASPHPLMMIPPDENIEKDEDGRSLCRFYDYLNKKDVNTNIKIPEEVDDAICVGSSQGWLAYISRRDCSVFLWNPFTTSPLIYLPPIHTLPFVTVIPREELDEEDSDVYNRSAYECYDNFPTDFGFKVERDYPGRSQSFYTRSPKRLSVYFIRKIILSSVPTSDDCIVVALPCLSSIHHTDHSIAFCKPGDKSWTFVEPPLKKYVPIVDVIHFRDQLFYAISSCGLTLYAYDLSDLSSPKSFIVETSFEFEPLSSYEEYKRRWCRGRHYLVESLGDLLWVRRLVANNMNPFGKTIFYNGLEFPTETVMFDVYRMDFSGNTWEYIKCIGDQGLFLGTNQSLSLTARDFSNLKANCIYFMDDSGRVHMKYPSYGGQDFGHYELGGYKFTELFLAVQECDKFGFSKVLPPPIWIMHNFH